jgi:hypothetical protein
LIFSDYFNDEKPNPAAHLRRFPHTFPYRSCCGDRNTSQHFLACSMLGCVMIYVLLTNLPYKQQLTRWLDFQKAGWIVDGANCVVFNARRYRESVLLPRVHQQSAKPRCASHTCVRGHTPATTPLRVLLWFQSETVCGNSRKGIARVLDCPTMLSTILQSSEKMA